MAKVEIYTKFMCPFCMRAKALLEKKGVAVIDIPATKPDVREQMNKRSNGGNTFPQIFINDKHIGGCDDLMALNRAGGLDPLLAD